MFNNVHSRPDHPPAKAKRPAAQRRYVVKEIIGAMSWSGTVWAVACKTRESADAAFCRRVTKNLIERDDPGAVMAYDRKTRQVFMSTADVGNPKAAARWWCR